MHLLVRFIPGLAKIPCFLGFFSLCACADAQDLETAKRALSIVSAQVSSEGHLVVEVELLDDHVPNGHCLDPNRIYHELRERSTHFEISENPENPDYDYTPQKAPFRSLTIKTELRPWSGAYREGPFGTSLGNYKSGTPIKVRVAAFVFPCTFENVDAALARNYRLEVMSNYVPVDGDIAAFIGSIDE